MSNEGLLEELRRRAMEQVRHRMFASAENVRLMGVQRPNPVGVDRTIELLKDFSAQVIAANPSVIPAFAPPKGQGRARQKVASDYGGDWYSLMDAARMTMIAPARTSLEGVVGTIRRLAIASNGYRLVKQKERRPGDSACGYSDWNFVVEMLNGRPAEIQVNTSTILYGQFPESDFARLVGAGVCRSIKQKLQIGGGMGHGLYEIYRVNAHNEKGAEAADLSRRYFEYLRGGRYDKVAVESLVQQYKMIAGKYPAILHH